jgi:hypothetical protein
MKTLQLSMFQHYMLNNLANQLPMNIDQQDSLNNYYQNLNIDRKDSLNMLVRRRLKIAPLDKSCIFYPAYKDPYKRNSLLGID